MLAVDAESRSIIRKHQAQAPVNVVGIAIDLGINVWHDTLPDGISGKLLRDTENGGSSGYSIVFNSSEPSTRRRFTIAHEIAHFLLHRGQIGEGVEDDVFYRSRLSNATEAEANRFAADILMPLELLHELQASGTREIPALARALRVSQQALKIRIGIPVVED
jgi:hypothetical protein